MVTPSGAGTPLLTDMAHSTDQPFAPLTWPDGRGPANGSGLGCAAYAALVLAAAALLAVRHHPVWLVIVVVGPVVYQLADRERALPALDHVDARLAARPSFPADRWGSPERADLAAFIARLVAEEADWPNHHFTPDDPLDVVLCCPLGDGMEWLVIARGAEKRTGRRPRWEGARTFGELVDLYSDGDGTTGRVAVAG